MALKYTESSLTAVLQSMGYNNVIKKSSTRFIILTNDNRVSVLENIKSKIPNSIYDRSPSSTSSVGQVKVDSFIIIAKPARRQGSASAGVENEKILVDTINNLITTGPVNVVFIAPNKKYSILGCTAAVSVGADTANRKKADVVLIDSKKKEYSISIKKDNAETWESADTYFNKEAKYIIEKAVSQGITSLVSRGSYFTLDPNIAVRATDKEKQAVVFGSDIGDTGAIISKSFSASSFKIDGDTLTVECSNIITKLSEVTGDKDVFFLMRNDSTRKSIKEYPGIRILASYKKRINKNVKVLDR